MSQKIILTTQAELAEIIQNAVAIEIQKAVANFQPPNPSPVSDYCLIAEASALTGLAESTIRTKCHHGEMPYFKPDGTKKLQFKRNELLIWIEAGRVKTIAEMEIETNQYLTSKRKKNRK